jgi:hypothetical protein
MLDHLALPPFMPSGGATPVIATAANKGICHHNMLCAQALFGSNSGIIDMPPLPSKENFVNTLADNICQWGVWNQLMSDRGVMCSCGCHVIVDWQGKPYHQHQSFAKRRWQHVMHSMARVLSIFTSMIPFYKLFWQEVYYHYNGTAEHFGHSLTSTALSTQETSATHIWMRRVQGTDTSVASTCWTISSSAPMISTHIPTKDILPVDVFRNVGGTSKLPFISIFCSSLPVRALMMIPAADPSGFRGVKKFVNPSRQLTPSGFGE